MIDMKKIANVHSDDPEEILQLFKENIIFKEFLLNYKENKLEFLNYPNLKKIVTMKKNEIYNDLKDKISEQVNIKENIENLTQNEDLENFIHFLTNEKTFKKILTDDLLENTIIEKQLKDYSTDVVYFDYDYYKNIENLFQISYDTISDIYESNHMNIIKSDTNDEKSFQIIAKNENQIVGGINMVSGDYFDYKDFDYVMTKNKVINH
jgi:phosphoglycerate-specific signal transduction histidine kinase